jgi:hypothetical protein
MDDRNPHSGETHPLRPQGLPDTAVLPDYDGLSITKIPDLVRAVLGLPVDVGGLVEAVDPPRFDRVLLLILDGFGFRRMEQLWDDYPDLELRRLASSGSLHRLTSVFPSTTVAALTTYSTGLSPLQHGMIGYRLYLRELSAITNMIQFSIGDGNGDSAFRAGLDLDSLLPAPTVYERLRDEGVTTHTLLPQYITTSGLSRLLYRGSTGLHPAGNLSDMFTLARQILDRSKSKTLLTLYWPGLDSLGHARGPGSDAYVAEVRAIDDALRRELVGRVEDTLLLVSSDHGFVAMETADYLSLGSIPDLQENALLRPVGEPRASYVYLRDGAKARLAWHTPAILTGDLLLLDPDDVIRTGILGVGQPHPETRNRLGDYLLVSTGRAGLYHPYPDAPYLRGMHGGLTEEEMYVPLVVSPL